MQQGRTVIFIAGPTGSGKTTLIRKLSKKVVVYIEDATLNPYLSGRSGHSFDAGASQTWFLDQMTNVLKQHPSGILAIDQHPRVVSRVYGTMFHDRGLLSGAMLSRLDRYADRVWRQAVGPSSQALTVSLSASTSSLKTRLRRRESRGLTMAEVSTVNRLYSGVVFPGPCFTMNTDVISVEYEATIINAWLSNPAAIRLDKSNNTSR
jgi:deoxyadenosine/deoxycytidine kinase